MIFLFFTYTGNSRSFRATYPLCKKGMVSFVMGNELSVASVKFGIKMCLQNGAYLQYSLFNMLKVLFFAYPSINGYSPVVYKSCTFCSKSSFFMGILLPVY